MPFNPFADFAMEGHIALITGGAQNIGEAIARTFAGAGAKVLIADLKGNIRVDAAAKAHFGSLRKALEVAGLPCGSRGQQYFGRDALPRGPFSFSINIRLISGSR